MWPATIPQRPICERIVSRTLTGRRTRNGDAYARPPDDRRETTEQNDVFDPHVLVSRRATAPQLVDGIQLSVFELRPRFLDGEIRPRTELEGLSARRLRVDLQQLPEDALKTFDASIPDFHLHRLGPSKWDNATINDRKIATLDMGAQKNFLTQL